MRVCILIEFFYPDSTGGTGATVSELARHLKDAHPDIQMDVITSSNLYRNSPLKLPEEENWDGIQIYRVKSAQTAKLSIKNRFAANVAFTGRALMKLLSLGRYDLVLTGTNPPMIAAAAKTYKMLTGTPYVYLIHDLEPDRSATLRLFRHNHPFVKVFEAFQGSWLRAAWKVVAIGEYMRDYMVEAYRLSPSQVEVIHVGANENVLAPGDRESSFRRKHQISGFVVLYTGNFGRYHNFDTVLDAAKELQDTDKEISIVLVGDGARKAHIIGRISDEQIRNVRVFDFVPIEEYSDLLATADVSIVTLEAGMETLCLPGKFYTNLASGRPVLALMSEKSDIARILAEESCGLQVEQGDTTKLIETLRWLSAHPEESIKMGHAARSVFTRRFGTNIVAEQYYDIFEEIVANRGPAADKSREISDIQTNSHTSSVTSNVDGKTPAKTAGKDMS